MKKLLAVAVVPAALLVPTACKALPQGGPAPASAELKTDDDKTFYVIGTMLGRNLAGFALTPQELALVEKGLEDAAGKKKPQVEAETYMPKVQELAKARMTAAANIEKEKAKSFADAAAQEPGAVRLPSGVVYKSLKPGTGAQPSAESTVKVHYTGTLTDGTEFDSSVKRGQPAEFPLNGVIKCWTEGVQKMKVGEKAKLVCPSDVAYGDQGRPPQIPGGATLVFEVELLEVKAPAAPAK